MFRLAPRLVGSAIVAALLLGSCSGQGDDEDAGDRSSPTTSAAAMDEDSTATTDGGSPSSTAGGSGTDNPPDSAPTAADDDEGIIELTITGGNVEGGVRRATVKQGAQVTIRATSDTADQLHVHTYDLKVDLVPGQSADITFLAKIAGVFEVELEGRGTKVLELEVRP